MRFRTKNRLAVWTSIFASVMLVMSAASAADLVSHNGFEACWSQALTKPQFLNLLQSTLDAQSGCVAPQTGSSNGITYEICNTAACAGGAMGCAVTTHAGTFSGDFVSGVFSGSGSADTIVAPITTNVGSCTLTISNLTLNYAPSYAVQADGNSGDYMATLLQSPLTVTSHTFSGNALCNTLASLYGPQLITQIETSGSATVANLLQAATVGESVCPLLP
ncbi:hypothetical protein ELE36_01945 [Pseudolysobacter antarcticus]|uniref:Uncharacterized protein n=1 Tax=Pseudolysobacter antarcticus TaxID=2511995 RepID=A0A411HFH8_9GAMM|nr:hypothetical protein [Pseudolysobacter antarcticus]QBB69238.1 hypothetical protein ELE36_01945 [Pseudolysobacter antarcticus]